jgi:hypothetical protein
MSLLALLFGVTTSYPTGQSNRHWEVLGDRIQAVQQGPPQESGNILSAVRNSMQPALAFCAMVALIVPQEYHQVSVAKWIWTTGAVMVMSCVLYQYDLINLFRLDRTYYQFWANATANNTRAIQINRQGVVFFNLNDLRTIPKPIERAPWSTLSAGIWAAVCWLWFTGEEKGPMDPADYRFALWMTLAAGCVTSYPALQRAKRRAFNYIFSNYLSPEEQIRTLLWKAVIEQDPLDV